MSEDLTTGSPLKGASSSSSPPSGSSSSSSSTTPKRFTEFTVLRQNMQDLAAHSNNNNNNPQLHLMSSPGSVRRIPRGDWTVSESLAGPNADELKGIRWRMKLLAEQAAAIVKGDKGAEQYVVFCATSTSATSPSQSPSSLAGIR